MLADTIGVGVPRQVRSLVPAALRAAGGIPIGLHLHNTRNTGYANADAGIEAGATLFDASIGGLGGCPFAPRATGNIATEDLVYLLDGLGVETGVDLDALISVAEWLARRARAGAPGAAVQGRPVRTDRLSEPWPSSHSSGLGRMGRLMPPHLVAAGHEVRGFDLDPAASRASADGCGGASARDAADGADVAITMLPSPDGRSARRRSGPTASPRASPPARCASTCRPRRRRSRASSRRARARAASTCSTRRSRAARSAPRPAR